MKRISFLPFSPAGHVQLSLCELLVWDCAVYFGFWTRFSAVKSEVCRADHVNMSFCGTALSEWHEVVKREISLPPPALNKNGRLFSLNSFTLLKGAEGRSDQPSHTHPHPHQTSWERE